MNQMRAGDAAVTTPSVVPTLTDTTVTVPTDTTGIAPTDTTGVVPTDTTGVVPTDTTDSVTAEIQRRLDAHDKRTQELMIEYKDVGWTTKELETYKKGRDKQGNVMRRSIDLWQQTQREKRAKPAELTAGDYKLNGKMVRIRKRGEDITLRADKDVIQAAFGVNKNRVTAHPKRNRDVYQKIMELFNTGALVAQ